MKTYSDKAILNRFQRGCKTSSDFIVHEPESIQTRFNIEPEEGEILLIYGEKDKGNWTLISNVRIVGMVAGNEVSVDLEDVGKSVVTSNNIDLSNSSDDDKSLTCFFSPRGSDTVFWFSPTAVFAVVNTITHLVEK